MLTPSKFSFTDPARMPPPTPPLFATFFVIKIALLAASLITIAIGGFLVFINTILPALMYLADWR